MEQFKSYGAGCCKCKEPITITTETEERRYLSSGMCDECVEKTIGTDILELSIEDKKKAENDEIWDDFIDRIDLLLVIEEDQNQILREIRDAIRDKRS